MSTTTTISWNHVRGGALTALAAVPKLSDSTGAYGVKNTSGGDVIVADAQDMTAGATGVYSYTALTVDSAEITWAAAGNANGTLAYNTQYTYSIEYAEDNETHRKTFNFTTPGDATSGRGTAAWAADEVEAYIGGVVTAGVALPYVQRGYSAFLAGMNPQTGMKHTWSFLKRSSEITLTASVEGTATGVYTASASGRQLGTIAVTATTEIFTSGQVGSYLTVENVGTFKITAYSSTTVVTVQVLTGQRAANFTSIAIWLAGIQDLPSDWDGLIGGFTYAYTDSYRSPDIVEVDAETVYRHWRDTNTENEAYMFAVVPKEFSTSSGQRWQLIYAPRVENTQTWRCQLQVKDAELTDSSSVQMLGGPQHWETIRALALASVELSKGNTSGVMRAQANRLLLGSIEADERMFVSHGNISLADADTGISRVG